MRQRKDDGVNPLVLITQWQLIMLITGMMMADDVVLCCFPKILRRNYETEVVITQVERVERGTRKQAERDEWNSERRNCIQSERYCQDVKTTKRNKRPYKIYYTAHLRGNCMEMEIAQQNYTTHQQQSGHSGLVQRSVGCLFLRKSFAGSKPKLHGTRPL